MTRAVETTDIISKHLPGECQAPQVPSSREGRVAAPKGTESCAFIQASARSAQTS